MAALLCTLAGVLIFFGRVSGQLVCEERVCLNGGICDDYLGYPSCDCEIGHIGFYCERQVSQMPCDISHCLNGGECPSEEPPHPQECVCPVGYFGYVCETSTCSSDTDCNGGTCDINLPFDANVCVSCPAGMSGPLCNNAFGVFCGMEDGICLNGGTCTPRKNQPGYRCTCPVDYAAPLCEVFQICSYTNPCLNNGDCVNGRCQCVETFKGILCEMACDIDGDCMNGGTCSVKGKCMCPDGFTGARCGMIESSLPCVENIECLNSGSCVNGVCECMPNFQGPLCEIACDDNTQCRNGGECDLTEGLCLCMNGYTGPHCRKVCENDACMNEGTACEEDTQCKNGGRCDQDEGYCECIGGYTGPHCQENPDATLSVAVIAVSVVAGIILLILIVVLVIVIRRRLTKRRYRKTSDGHQLEMADRNRKQSNEYIENKNGPAVAKRTSTLNHEPGEKEFPREQLHMMEQLGAGSFATVHRAEAEGIIKKGIMSTVAVKMLKSTATDGDKSDFEKERNMYITLGSHQNVVTMLGYCTEQEPFFLIMEYMPNGNLQSYLRHIRSDVDEQYFDLKEEKKRNYLLPVEILSFASQIANGMEFLSSNSCIHRDLATRNILLGDDLVAKVSDFGLARDVQDSSQYEMKSKGRVPVRWMAPESLLDNVYTSKSDVWGFSVLMWELVTLGSHPYPGMSSRQVIDEIAAGYRLPKPESCSDELYNMMRSCWENKPQDRPTFAQVCKILDNMMADANGYLVMADLNRDDYLYLEPSVNTKSIGTGELEV